MHQEGAGKGSVYRACQKIQGAGLEELTGWRTAASSLKSGRLLSAMCMALSMYVCGLSQIIRLETSL